MTKIQSTPNRIRTTIASSNNGIALILAIAGFLAEKGSGAAVQGITQKIGAGDLPGAFDLAQRGVHQAVFGDVENPIDLDGKAIYVGMHPFKENTFGIYRSELRDQRIANLKTEGAADLSRAARTAARNEKKALKLADAEARARKSLEKAEKAQARAEQIAKKYKINLGAVKDESATTAEVDNALREIHGTPSNKEHAATA